MGYVKVPEEIEPGDELVITYAKDLEVEIDLSAAESNWWGMLQGRAIIFAEVTRVILITGKWEEE